MKSPMVAMLALAFLLSPLACKKPRTLLAPKPLPVATAPAPVAPPEPKDEIVLTSPYRPSAHAYKGQLHTHTNVQGGLQSPTAVMTAYRRAGFDFVSITDHNHNTRDPGVEGILFIPGIENDFNCQHENRIDATTPAPGARMPKDVIAQANVEGSFVIINHPDWPGAYPTDPCWSDAALLAATGYDAVEVWNAGNEPVNRNTEARLDLLLSQGRRTSLIAVDDCHDVNAAYCMTAWVTVYADALTKGDIMQALRAGNFYASSGAEISTVTAAGHVLTVTVPVSSTIEFIADKGRTIETERDVLSATYAVGGAERYVRIRVTRPDKSQAWSNPIYVSKTP